VTFDVGYRPGHRRGGRAEPGAIAQRQLPQQVVAARRQRWPSASRRSCWQWRSVRTIRATTTCFFQFRHAARLRRSGARARSRPGGGVRRRVTTACASGSIPQKWRASASRPDVSTILNEQNVVAPAGTVGAEPAPRGSRCSTVASVQDVCRVLSSTATSWCAPGPTGPSSTSRTSPASTRRH